MRLNGWQRIGVITSAGWVVWSAWQQMRAISDRGDIVFRLTQELCIASQDQTRKCLEEAGQALHRNKADWSDLVGWLLMAFVPVLLVWLAAYIVIWLTRWVRRGFVQDRADAK